jgi:galactoside O-acetyltransferase
MSVYSPEELQAIGFAYLGKDVKLSRRASFYNPANISIGDYSRIDDFCVLSAGENGIFVGRYVHIAVYSALIGKANITLLDFCNLSARVSIYSSNDDYSGEYMTNPTVNERFTNVCHAPVLLNKHVIIGAGTIVLPGVVIGEGASVGALSLVKEDCNEFTVYCGVPAKRMKERSRNLLEQEKQFVGQLE